MTITFSNGAQLEYLDALETEEYFNGASRRTLTFKIDPQYSVDQINTICNDEANLTSLTLSAEMEDGNIVTNIYDGYVLKLKIGHETEPTGDEMNSTIDRIVLKLGKRTVIEQKLHELGVL